MFEPKKNSKYLTTVLILSAIFLSTCSETSEFGEASDYEKLGASCVNSTGDTSTPTISTLSPSDNSTNVPIATKIVVKFSDAMLAHSVTTNTKNTNCSGSLQLSSDNFSTCIKMSASPSASDNDTTFTITPASSLSLSTNYKFKTTTSVSETSCNKLATDNTTTNGFTTAGAGSGTIKGKVISDSDQSDLSGVNVNFYGTTIDNTTSDTSGDYSSQVDVGDYTISYSLEGYINETQTAPLETDGQTLEVQTLRMLPTSCDSTGTISGKITDAVSGNAVSSDSNSGTLYLCRGLLNLWNRGCWQDWTATTSHNSSGEYSFSDIGRGWYTIKTDVTGYIQNYFHVRSCGDIGDQDFALSETLPSDKYMRIVLSWLTTSPQTGKDLDSHIQVPDNSSGSRHLHFGVANKIITYSSTDNVTLDRDETDSPGTETITIIEVKSDKNYSYSVHDYTNRDNSSSNKLADSGASVTVYYNNTTNKYSVPSGVGNLWRVFTFTVSGGLTEVGTMTYENTYTDVY